jgi:ubiquitin C-terminal hydrolase
MNITTNKSSNSIPDEVRNEIDFNIGCTTSTTTLRSLSSFNYSQPNNNEDNSNKETHETSDNEEHDSHSNQDSTVNCRRYLKRKANETSSCAQGDPQTKCPRNKEPLYYKEFPVQRRNARHIEKDGRTAGLLNNNVICYANAIFQLLANCNKLNEYLLNPPREENQRFRMYYEFACVISAMVSEETVDAVNSQNFMDVFLDIFPQFKDDERTYCAVVSTNELYYNHISILLISFLFFQTSEDTHEYMMYLRESQLKELQPKQEDPSVTAFGQPYDKHLHQSMRSFWNLFTSGMMKQTVRCQQCDNVTTTNESFTELMLIFPSSHQSKQSETCTLNDLFEHKSLPSDIKDYVCNCCKKRTIAAKHEEISVYPEFLIIVLCREIGIAEVNENNINTVNTAVEFPLEGFATVSNVQ